MNAGTIEKQPLLDTSLQGQAPRRYGGLPPWRWYLWWSVWVLWIVVDTAWFRLRVRGAENIPKDGGYFILSNHTAMLDPFWKSWALQRPLQYMAASSVLKIPVLGPILAGLGAFGKKKYVKDRASMLTMARLYQDGQAVVIYPEGLRTWNGLTQPVIPGIGRLIKRMKARVVYSRIDSAFLIHPRWARYPRWAPVEISFEGPYTYPDDWSAEEIEADVQRRITTIPHLDTRKRAWGFRLAWGLPEYLWACPRCFAEEGLQVDPRNGDRLRCRGCGGRWRLDIESRLQAEDGGQGWTLPEAVQRITDHVGVPPVMDRPRLEREGVLLEASRGRVLRHLKEEKRKEVVAEGLLRLGPDGLSIRGPEGSLRWELPLKEVKAVSIEVASEIFLRTGTELYTLEPGGESACKWAAFTRAWHAVATGSEPAPHVVASP